MFRGRWAGLSLKALGLVPRGLRVGILGEVWASSKSPQKTLKPLKHHYAPAVHLCYRSLEPLKPPGTILNGQFSTFGVLLGPPHSTYGTLKTKGPKIRDPHLESYLNTADDTNPALPIMRNIPNIP